MVVSKLVNLITSPASPTSINVSWNVSISNWIPESYIITACQVRTLAVWSETDIIPGGTCKEETLSQSTSSHVIEGLKEFTEYNITIQGNIPELKSNDQASALGRTG